MSTLVFSDTHFGKSFDENRFNILIDLISKSSRVIINGDFWEGMGISFEDFLNSDWKQLFPFLKNKDTIYIYGNHDDESLSDNKVFRFCNIAVKEYILETPLKKYVFKHGYQFLFPKVKDKNFQKYISEACSNKTKVVLFITSLIQRIGFGLFGPKILPYFINTIPDEIKNNTKYSHSMLVCGHTHRPYFNKRDDFIDIGFFNYGWCNYLIIDKDGSHILNSKRY